jgi:hypothetical protein
VAASESAVRMIPSTEDPASEGVSVGANGAASPAGGKRRAGEGDTRAIASEGGIEIWRTRANATVIAVMAWREPSRTNLSRIKEEVAPVKVDGAIQPLTTRALQP